jgi:uncharacterized alkaline shock family protein YloU
VTASSINPRGGGFDDPRPVTEIRIAALAAAAARATPGVAHLQPGLWGLVAQLGTELWTRATGKPRPDTGGVEVAIDVHADTTTIDITLVTDGLRPAAATAAHVQRAVHQAVTDSGAAPPTRIAVHITDIAPAR